MKSNSDEHEIPQKSARFTKTMSSTITTLTMRRDISRCEKRKDSNWNSITFPWATFARSYQPPYVRCIPLHPLSPRAGKYERPLAREHRKEN